MVHNEVSYNQHGQFDAVPLPTGIATLSAGALALSGGSAALGLGLLGSKGIAFASLLGISSTTWLVAAVALGVLALILLVFTGAHLITNPHTMNWEDLRITPTEDELTVYRQVLEQNPEQYFFNLAASVEQRREIPSVDYIEIDGRSHGTDAGGLKRDFLSSLFFSLFQEGQNAPFPIVRRGEEGGVVPLCGGDEDAIKLRSLGKIFAHIQADNEHPVIGPVFSEEVFDGLYTLLNCPQSEQIRLGIVTSWDRLGDDTLLTLFTQIDPTHKTALSTALYNPGALEDAQRPWLTFFINPADDESSAIQTDRGGEEPRTVEEWPPSRQTLANACKARLSDSYQSTTNILDALFHIARGVLERTQIQAPTSRELECQIVRAVSK